ncbi:MAG TPA: class I adenylate-forming enzyme family protein [Thermodesulfobacteriota bacterium]|nr:class I adenylate-forming enzyme family protein [Thermodesulfobacteriota bacterium]
MGLIQEITRVFLRYQGKAATSHYVPPGSLITLTYSQLEKRVRELAQYLSRQGMEPGDLIMCYMTKSVDLVVSILAIMLNGGTCCCFYSKQNPQYALKLFSFANPRFILLEENTLRSVKKHMERVEPSHPFPSCGRYPEEGGAEGSSANPHRTIYVLNYPSAENGRTQGFQEVGRRSDKASWCLFTSGSTGSPKGVLISGEDLLQRAVNEIEDYEITDQDCLLSLLPFSFDVGLNQLLSSVLSGAHLVLLNSWFPKDILTTVRSRNISGISGVPSIWAEALAYPKGPDFDQNTQTLRYLTVSGGDLSKNQLLQLRQCFRNSKIFKTYGQTETFRSSMLKPFDFERKMTSVGRPLKGTEVFVLNEKGEITPPNTEGEIVHHGVGTMLGYLNDSEGTSEKLRKMKGPGSESTKEGTWVFTGDRGKMDEEGYLYVLGREDGMIKTLGHRVYPKEIEGCILEYEQVKNAAVVGIKDERKGQVIIAEVVANGDLNKQSLIVYLRERLPYYMVPGEINVVEYLPMTESGKIRYATIRERYEERRFL